MYEELFLRETNCEFDERTREQKTPFIGQHKWCYKVINYKSID